MSLISTRRVRQPTFLSYTVHTIYQEAFMQDAFLRRQKDRLMTPVAGSAFAAIHPNHISVIAMLIGLGSVVAILGQWYWLGLLLWAVNRIMDGLDGVVARVHQKQSDFGGYLDLFLDFIIYLAVPIAFIAAMPTTANLWAGIFLLTSYVLNSISWTTLAALLEKRQRQTVNRLTSMEMPTGLVEGAETIVFYTLFYLLPNQIAILFLVMAILVVFTASQRVWWAYWHLQ
ncbi:MAG: CDP-alcohol phosphatidyltransferase family protein [Caldilinea sp. CFX5]|nr:CDP-alcohol phosphatidyltransferase family protein [Caldilinea sp. CFX5]